MKPGKQTFLKPCLAVPLLLAALFGVWRVWDVRHKSIDTADDRQMAAPLLPLQNPTLISGEHGYRSDKEEISEPFAVTSQSKRAEEKWDEGLPPFMVTGRCKKTETESKPVIYLYPEAETEVSVRLEYQGRLTIDCKR